MVLQVRVTLFSCCVTRRQSYSLVCKWLCVFQLPAKLADDLRLFWWRKFISFPGHYWGDFKILSGRRRLCTPFQTRQMPGVSFCSLAIAHGPDEIDCRYQHAESQDRSARAGEH